jgi:hypothetical protein
MASFDVYYGISNDVRIMGPVELRCFEIFFQDQKIKKVQKIKKMKGVRHHRIFLTTLTMVESDFSSLVANSVNRNSTLLYIRNMPLDLALSRVGY